MITEGSRSGERIINNRVGNYTGNARVAIVANASQRLR